VKNVKQHNGRTNDVADYGSDRNLPDHPRKMGGIFMIASSRTLWKKRRSSTFFICLFV